MTNSSFFNLFCGLANQQHNLTLTASLYRFPLVPTDRNASRRGLLCVRIMVDPETPHDEAFRRLDKRLDAMDRTSHREPVRFDEGSGAGYRVVGELIGGVLTGLGFGWLLDRFAGTNPWGLIGGMLIGTGVSIFLVARSAGRMTTASETQASPKATPDSAAKDENGPG